MPRPDTRWGPTETGRADISSASQPPRATGGSRVDPAGLLRHATGQLTPNTSRPNQTRGSGGGSPAELLAETAGEPGEGLPALPDSDGRLRLDPDDVRAQLYGDVDETVATRAVELPRPEPSSIFAATPAHVSSRDTLSIYLRGKRDRTIATPLPDLFAARCSRRETWATSHLPYLGRPAVVGGCPWVIAEVAHGSAGSADALSVRGNCTWQCDNHHDKLWRKFAGTHGERVCITRNFRYRPCVEATLGKRERDGSGRCHR